MTPPSQASQSDRCLRSRRKTHHDLLHVQSTAKRVFHHPGEKCRLFLQGRMALASPNKPRIYRRSIISSPGMTSKSKPYEHKLKAAFYISRFVEPPRDHFFSLFFLKTCVSLKVKGYASGSACALGLAGGGFGVWLYYLTV